MKLVKLQIFYIKIIYIEYTIVIPKKHESRIAIKKGCSDRYLAWKDTDATFKDNDNVIPVIVMRHNSYYEPLIEYRYDTKQVIWEFDRWLI